MILKHHTQNVATNGHIDEFARFVNDATILFAQIGSTEFADLIAFEKHKRAVYIATVCTSPF